MRCSYISYFSDDDFIEKLNLELHTLESIGKKIIDVKFSCDKDASSALILYEDKEEKK